MRVVDHSSTNRPRNLVSANILNIALHTHFKMSVRVVARVRPLLKSELEKDQIVTSHAVTDGGPTIVKIPNPKNFAEEFSFQFNSVYEQESTQQELFEAEGTTCRVIVARHS